MKKLLSRLITKNFLKPCKPSLLAMSIVGFTNENHLTQIMRQGRLDEFTIKH